jgi:hypothetical protein
MTLDTLPFSDRRAIELRYLGYGNQEIADEIGLAYGTVAGLFTTGGRLENLFEQYCKKMNTGRDKEAMSKLVESDENIAKLTTNVIRQFAMQLSAVGKRLMVVDETNAPVLDSSGKPQIIYLGKSFQMKDLEKAWKMQRILSGKHTDMLGITNNDEIDSMLDKARTIFGTVSEDQDEMEKLFKENPDEAIRQIQGSGS